MKIALLSWETLHSIPVGGVAAHVTELGEALAKRGHHVHIFTRMGAGQSRYDNVNQVHYHRCPFDIHPDFVTEANSMCNSFVWHLGEVEEESGKPFDIVHGHDWLCAKGVVQAKNDRGAKAVFTMHSTEYGRCGNRLCGGTSAQIRDLEWEGTYVADKVICVSGKLESELHDIYQLPDEKTHVIYNGVDVQRYNARSNVGRVRYELEIGDRDPIILFVGRLAWQKGPDILLESIPHLLKYYPNAKFVFVGDGDMRPGLEMHAQRAGITNAVRFLGYRSGKDLIDLFKSADLICVPSRNEPFGIVILEAWSASKPVVATRNGGPAEFVHHGYTGFTVYDNADSIGWGVGTAMEDQENARWMGRNGRQEAESHFSWNKIAEDTEKVYESI